MRRIFCFLVLMGLAGVCAGGLFEMDLGGVEKEVRRGHLGMGGVDPEGEEIGFTSFYMEVNGRAVIPVIGEFHYLRYPAAEWGQEIRKMKAGGIDVMATYLFWSLHEEEEGVFEWSGQRDARRFIEMCAAEGMRVIARIGPFCHGEIRNGGLPDWLYGRPFEVRSNDEGYLKYVRRWYGEVGRQLEGLMFGEGGPIIAVQLENEYQHSAASWAWTYAGQAREYTAARQHRDEVLAGVGSKPGESVHSSAYGVEHMRRLKAMAEEAGIRPAFFTATGWGGAAVIEHETLPVQAGYAYPTWAKVGPSGFYLFKDLQESPDYVPAKYRLADYPAFYAELGPGIEVTYSQRRLVPAESVDPMIVRMLGSGANGIGYYMYHGGTTPRGKRGFLNEDIGGLRHVSYDFQAPLGEAGQRRESFERLRVLHEFVREFGEVLAPMGTVLPEGAGALEPTDTERLRWAVRQREGRGFVFLVNFQDEVEMRDREGVRFSLRLEDEVLEWPGEGFTLRKDVACILPFNFAMGGVELKWATAQLLTRVEGEGVDHYVFFTVEGIKPEYVFDAATVRRVDVGGGTALRHGGRWQVGVRPGLGSRFRVTGVDGREVLVTTLTYGEALGTRKMAAWGADRLVVTQGIAMAEGDSVRLLTEAAGVSLAVWPGVEGGLEASAGQLRRIGSEGVFETYAVEIPERRVRPEVEWLREDKFVVRSPEGALEGLNELWLELEWRGDTAMAFLDGELVSEDFYIGRPWRVALKRLGEAVSGEGVCFVLKAAEAGAEWMEGLPGAVRLDFSGGSVVGVDSVRLAPEYEVRLRMKNQD